MVTYATVTQCITMIVACTHTRVRRTHCNLKFSRVDPGKLVGAFLVRVEVQAVVVEAAKLDLVRDREHRHPHVAALVVLQRNNSTTVRSCVSNATDR